jgi:hypothetical protein
MIRRLGHVATVTHLTQRGYVDQRHIYVDQAQELRLTLQTARRNAKMSVVEPGPQVQAQWAEIEADIAELQDAIRQLDAEIDAATADSARAAKLLERILQASEQTHPGFRGIGDIIPSGPMSRRVVGGPLGNPISRTGK